MFCFLENIYLFNFYFVHAQTMILIIINTYVNNAKMSLRSTKKDKTRKNTFISYILIDVFTF